ncbi:uncharacterized protein LOC131309831 isoform X1 [Rhododendron vialii]|uniref:uncharacterized protein LOC131309831 isoform X1 n=1 Tax=Rhododendron vialii TaxID=182163 RepID=UPI00265FF9AA|nr:uncharacterized protein LOC131309831 isoform X1 [Rhododendron vialii]
MSRIWASESGWYAIQYPHKTHLSATDEEIDKPPPWKMAFLPLSLTLSIPSISPPPFTAAVSLPSLRALRRSTAIFTRSRRPPGVVCAIPWDFSFDFEIIEPPYRADIFPEFEPMPIPLPPPMPADPPLQHVPDEEEEGEEEYYEYEEEYEDPDDYFSV